MCKKTRMRATALAGIVAAVLGAPGVYGQGTIECKNTAPDILPLVTAEFLRKYPAVLMPSRSREELQRMPRRPPAKRNTTEVIIPSGIVNILKPGTPEPADVKEIPYADAGRLFSSGGACSGGFVGSSTVLLTAAHCVRNGTTGDWFWQFMFWRAYADNGGTQPEGQSVTTTCVCTWSAWPNQKGGNNAFDYAFIKTAQPSDAGWLGIRLDVPYPAWTAVGYPVNYGGGRFMYKVIGGKGTEQGNTVQMVGNPMRKGSSGGPWIGAVNSSGSEGNYVIGLNSFYLDDEPNSIYGPYFDSSVLKLFEHVANGNGCK